MQTTILLLIPVVVLAALAVCNSYRWPFRRLFWSAGAVIAAIRLSAFWYLLFAEATGRQSLSLLPLVFLLFPEVYFVPQGHVWTVLSGALFSAVLLVGSFVLALFVACVNISLSYFLIGDIQLEKAVDRKSRTQL